MKNHSIQYSIQKQNQNIHSKNLFIQNLNQIIHSKNLFIQKQNQIIHSKNYSFKLDKTTQLEKTVRNLFVHSIIHSIVRQKYSFKEFIH